MLRDAAGYNIYVYFYTKKIYLKGVYLSGRALA